MVFFISLQAARDYERLAAEEQIHSALRAVREHSTGLARIEEQQDQNQQQGRRAKSQEHQLGPPATAAWRQDRRARSQEHQVVGRSLASPYLLETQARRARSPVSSGLLVVPPQQRPVFGSPAVPLRSSSLPPREDSSAMVRRQQQQQQQQQQQRHYLHRIDV